MSSTLFDPTTLLNRLQAQTGETVKSFSAVADLVSRVYQCSLYKEESREVRCRVIVIQGQKDFEHLDILRLFIPVPLSVAILRKLSPVTAESENALVVDCTGENAAVIGCTTPGTLMELSRVLEIQQSPYEIECFGPGVIEISAHSKSVRFARDKYVTPELHRAVPCAIPSTSVPSLVRRAAYPGIAGLFNHSMGRGAGVSGSRQVSFASCNVRSGSTLAGTIRAQ